jgi:hypothetical protein
MVNTKYYWRSHLNIKAIVQDNTTDLDKLVHEFAKVIMNIKKTSLQREGKDSPMEFRTQKIIDELPRRFIFRACGLVLENQVYIVVYEK